MSKLKNIMITLAALVAMTSYSFAFEGLSIGTVYTDADFSTSGSETTDAGGGVLQKKSTSKSGSAEYGSVFVEYTFAQGSTIGAELIPGDADLGKGSRVQAAAGLGASGDAAGTINVSATVSDHTTLYVEPTYMMNEKFGVYLKGGAAKVTVTPKYTETADVIQSTYNSRDVYGVMTGFGAKYYMGNMFVKLEYVETEYGAYTFQSTTGDLNTITADIEQEATRVALAYNF